MSDTDAKPAVTRQSRNQDGWVWDALASKWLQIAIALNSITSSLMAAVR